MPSPISPIQPPIHLAHAFSVKTGLSGFLPLSAHAVDSVMFGSNKDKPGDPRRAPFSTPRFLPSTPQPVVRTRPALPEQMTLPCDSLIEVFWRYYAHCTTSPQALALLNRLNDKRFCVSTPDKDSLYDLAMLDTHPVVLDQKGRIILDTLDNAEKLIRDTEGKAANTEPVIDRIDWLEAFLLERLATTGHMPYLKAYDKRLLTGTVVSVQPRVQAFDDGRHEYTFNAHHEVVNLRHSPKNPFREYNEPVMIPGRDGPKPLKVIVRDPNSYAIKPDQTVDGLDSVAHDITQALIHPTVKESVRQALDRLSDNRTDIQAFTADVTQVITVINHSLAIEPGIEIIPPPEPTPAGTHRERLGMTLAPAYYDDHSNTIGFDPTALWKVFKQREELLFPNNPVMAKHDRAQYVLKAMVEEGQHAWQQRLVLALLEGDHPTLIDLARHNEMMLTRLGDYAANIACYNQGSQLRSIGLDIDHWYKKQPIERDAKTVTDLVVAAVRHDILPPEA